MNVQRTYDAKHAEHVVRVDGQVVASAHRLHVKLDSWAVNEHKPDRHVGFGTEAAAVATLDAIAQRYREEAPAFEVKTDRRGLPYVINGEGRAMHVSPCCTASVTISTDDGVTFCKACGAGVDYRLGDIPDAPEADEERARFREFELSIIRRHLGK